MRSEADSVASTAAGPAALLVYRLFDEIDFSIIKNLPGNSTVGNFGQLRADGQLGADGQLHKIFEQVQNRFHWNKALGG